MRLTNAKTPRQVFKPMAPLHGPANRAAVIALPLLAAAIFAYFNTLLWVFTEYRMGVNADSSGYLTWYPLRGPGYSGFLHLVHYLLGDLRYLGLVQLNLLLLSFAALSYGVGRLTSSLLSALVLLLLLCALVPLILRAAWIGNEAVFAALICFHLSALCCYLRCPSASSIVCIGATIVGIYIVRSAGLPFAATALAVLWWFTPPPPPQNTTSISMCRKRILASLGVPIVASLLLLGSINHSVHGHFSVQMQGGVFLLGHVAHLIRAEDGEGSQYEQLLRELATELEPERQRIVTTTGLYEYWWETRLAGKIIWGTLFPKLGQNVERASALEWFEAVGEDAMELSLITIAAHPWEYMQHVAAHYLAAYRYGLVMRPVDFPGNAAYLYTHTKEWFVDEQQRAIFADYTDTAYFFDEHNLARYQAKRGDNTLVGRGWAFAVDNRAILISIVLLLSILSWVFMLLPRHRRDPLFQFCAYLGFLLHANVLFIAAVHPTLNRYTLPLLPLLTLLLVCTPITLLRVRRNLNVTD